MKLTRTYSLIANRYRLARMPAILVIRADGGRLRLGYTRGTMSDILAARVRLVRARHRARMEQLAFEAQRREELLRERQEVRRAYARAYKAHRRAEAIAGWPPCGHAWCDLPAEAAEIPLCDMEELPRTGFRRHG